jgi:hypothetical protein
VDKWRRSKHATLIGCLLNIVAFVIIGPVSVFAVEITLLLVIMGLSIQALGMSAVTVSSFGDARYTARQCGIGVNLQTYGLISGLWTAFDSLGTMIGQFFVDKNYDVVNYLMFYIFNIVLQVIMSTVLVFFLFFEKKLPRSQSHT